jgi:hypothetical protein
MPSLHSTLNQLLEDFVSAIVGALRTSTVQELLGASSEERAPSVAPPRPPTARPAPPKPRVVRSDAEMEPYTRRIVALIAQNPRGLPAGKLSAAVNLEGRPLERALRHALAAGDVVRQGTRGQALYLPANHGRRAEPAGPPRQTPPRKDRAPRASAETHARDAYNTHDPAQIHDPEALLRRQEAPTLPLAPPLVEDTALAVEVPLPAARLDTPTLREGEEILRTASGRAVIRRGGSSGV